MLIKKGELIQRVRVHQAVQLVYTAVPCETIDHVKHDCTIEADMLGVIIEGFGGQPKKPFRKFVPWANVQSADLFPISETKAEAEKAAS